jgi:hypothetical protein
VAKPLLGSGDTADFPSCTGWTQAALDGWHGPYITAAQITDPWGTNIWFDSDYEAYRDCASVNQKPGTLVVAVSAGPDKTGAPFSGTTDTSGGQAWSGYGCDDIFIKLY